MSQPAQGFSELNLAAPLLKAVTELGYESALPIQAACIPPLLEGKDVLGLAQTGTGKTAAFALPLLSRVELDVKAPQVLVLTPTRELAIQVAEAFQAYARHLKGFHVLPIYGGQRYSFQFNQLRRGPHVIVGTPGRIQDHLDRGTLDLSGVSSVVLDEADEMLRMGFVEAVEAILAKTPEDRQMALFSATMPPQIKRISRRHLKEPVEIRIENKTMTADNIEQVYMVVPQSAKFEALVRVLETESYDGIIIFARTRLATTELAEKLAARGYDVAALSGEMTQVARERTIKRLKTGKLDMIVATDVAARGLDVERISLVVNYDIPGDSEAYVHRIGRTGRVGRYGKAILFASPRERYLLQAIERLTRQPLQRMEMPSHDAVTAKRVDKFRDELSAVIEGKPMSFFEDLSFDLMEAMQLDVLQLAAAALCFAQKDKPLQAQDSRALTEARWDDPRPVRRERGVGPDRGQRVMPRNMILYRIDSGSANGVEVRNIVGAVTNETGLRNRFIGQIRIHPEYSTIELPDDLPPAMIEHLKKVYVGGRAMKLSRARGDDAPETGRGKVERPKPKPKPRAKPKPKTKAKKAKPKKAKPTG
jgi:ATP-dependent RNA helicase DeaD